MDELQKAPVLPKGYFFLVRGATGWVYRIELRRRVWKFSYKLGYSHCDTPAYVRARMIHLQTKYLPSSLGDDSIYGEYPPKTIIGGKD